MRLGFPRINDDAERLEVGVVVGGGKPGASWALTSLEPSCQVGGGAQGAWVVEANELQCRDSATLSFSVLMCKEY